MAQDIVGSLFGVSANDLQAQRQAAAQAQARQYAQMQPAEMVNYAGYMAGNQLGGALAGMMGAKDPELEKAAKLQQLTSQFDLTSEEGLLNAARTLASNGFQPQAMAMAQRAQEVGLTTAKTNTERTAQMKNLTEAKSKEADAAAKQMGIQGRAAFIKRKVEGVTDEEALALAQDDKVAADLLKEPKRETKLTTADGVVKLIDSNTGATIAVIGKAPASMEEALAGGIAGIRGETAQLKLDAERQKAEEGKKAKINALTTGYYDAQNVLQTATKALGLAPNSFTGASIQALTQVIPWSDSKALGNLVDTLKSAEGLGKLQELKRMSANGASGLGATSEKELDLLIKSLTALDPTDKNFKAQLSTVITRYNRLSKLMEADFKGITGRPLMSEAEEAPMDTPTASPTKAPARVKWGDMQSTK